MKKLGLIFVVFLCFSLFLSPTKSSAQGNENTNTGVTVQASSVGINWGEVETFVASVHREIITVQNIGNSGVSPKFVEKLRAIQMSVRNSPLPPNSTTKSIISKIMLEFSTYVSSSIDSSWTGTKKINNQLIQDIVTTKLNQSVADLAVENGTLSQADSDTAIAETEILSAERIAQGKQNLAKIYGSCGFTNPIACVGPVFEWVIKTFLLNIAGFLVWMSANMLNYAIQVGILDFKSWAPDALYPIWIVVRQIVSLFVVFAGLWLGLMYIIGKDETFEKYIPWVVIFALFVNFSYPLVRAAVDISNVVSLNIYASAVGNDALSPSPAAKNTAGALIMARLGLEGLVMSATKGEGADSANIVKSINSAPGALMAVIFVLYAAYIFFMVTALIIMRTVALVFLIIASPILFIDSVIPRLGDEAVKLRKIFFEQLAVGPVFMIMLALTLKFLDVFSGVAKSRGFVANPAIVEFFNIAMMLIMLHVMLKVTKSTAGSIGQMATNAMGKVGGFAGGAALGLATGGAGLLARGTMGRAAGALRDSKWMQSNQGGMIGRHMYNMTDSVAKSSFDARNSSYVQTGAKKLGLSSGMGAGNKMGYEEIAEQRAKNLTAHLGRIGTHKNNVYDADGKMIARKGDVNTTDSEAIKVRSEYIKNAGGAMFATKQEKDDIKYALQETAGGAKTLEEENISKYKNTNDSEEREKLFNKQTKETQEKMLDQDMKSAKKEDKVFDKEKEKQEIAKSQIASTQKLAESNEQLADALRTQKSSISKGPYDPEANKSPFEKRQTEPTSNSSKGPEIKEGSHAMDLVPF